MRDVELATIMQQQEEERARKLMEKEQQTMTSTLTGKALLLAQCVLSLHQFIQSSIPQNLGDASKGTILAMDSMFFFAYCLLRLQAVFRVAVKNATVDMGHHYTNLSYLGMICTNGLMNSIERITNRAIVTTIFLASLPMIYGIWDVLSTIFFLVPHFVMLIVDTLTACCLFLYIIASISLQCSCFYFQISQHLCF